MSKFHFHQNGISGSGRPIYDVMFDDPRGGTKHLGLVTRRNDGWATWVRHNEERGYPTRNAAAERLLLVSGLNPKTWSALPTDPFEGVSA